MQDDDDPATNEFVMVMVEMSAKRNYSTFDTSLIAYSSQIDNHSMEESGKEKIFEENFDRQFTQNVIAYCLQSISLIVDRE